MKSALVFCDSDNFSGYMTQKAYKEYRLQMSTGDFHTHTHHYVIAIDPMAYMSDEFVWDLDEHGAIYDSCITANEYLQNAHLVLLKRSK